MKSISQSVAMSFLIQLYLLLQQFSCIEIDEQSLFFFDDYDLDNFFESLLSK